MSKAERSKPRRPQFNDLQDGGADAGARDVNLDVILDVPVTLSMEVGRTRIPIRNLLQLNQGSVVELDRAAGEPLDVFVNGTLVAHGEVVVVNEKFGIRLTDVISPAERIKKLRVSRRSNGQASSSATDAASSWLGALSRHHCSCVVCVAAEQPFAAPKAAKAVSTSCRRRGLAQVTLSLMLVLGGGVRRGLGRAPPAQLRQVRAPAHRRSSRTSRSARKSARC